MTDLQFAKELTNDMEEYFQDKSKKEAHLIFNKEIKDFDIIKSELNKKNYSMNRENNCWVIRKIEV